jgi:ZIP family zinc transporter
LDNINILILALLSGLATLIGVFIGRHYKNSKKDITFGTAFAAGIMLLIVTFELIPSSYGEAGLGSLVWIALGIAVLYIVNRILPNIHSVKEIDDCDDKCMVKMSYLLAIGLILHDFPEGFAIPSSFASSDALGFLLVLATFVHNIPEGYVLTAASSKYKKDKFYYKSGLYSGFSTFLGALLGIILISQFSYLSPIFLALAAGAMLFIALHELIPVSLKSGRIRVFTSGIASSVVLYILIDLFL